MVVRLHRVQYRLSAATQPLGLAHLRVAGRGEGAGGGGELAPAARGGAVPQETEPRSRARGVGVEREVKLDTTVGVNRI